MNDREKSRVASRLGRIEGQIRGIRRMLEEDRYCMDILTQTSAVMAALRAVEDMVMERHLNTCVADAMRNDGPDGKQEKVDEVMGIITKFRKHG